VSGPVVPHAVAHIWKNEAARLVAVLTRTLHDVGSAEDMAHEALIAALKEWPRSGVPERLGAWFTIR
jgi:RNA polymerase sigma-70 factor, ECF subfamily